METIQFGAEELIVHLWRKKMPIIFSAAIFAVGFLALSYAFTPKYQASAILAPSEDSGEGNLAKLSSGFGGLASLAGISIRPSKASKDMVALEILRSQTFINFFAEKHNLGPTLAAGIGWDAENKNILYDRDIYDPDKSEWQTADDGRSYRPTAWEIYRAFSNYLTISNSEKTGFTTISVTHYSPGIAKDWANWLVSDINAYCRDRDKSRLEKNIAYLKNQAQETNISEMRTIFYRLIAEQEKQLMLAEATSDYVFSVLSPALEPDVKNKSSPKRMRFLLVGALLGFLGAMLVTIINWRFKG